ncbi:hypothetical protein RDABS01_038461 [Bienertia sinuspersici]
MGEFVEFGDIAPIGWSKYMRFCEDLRLDKPLKRFSRVAVLGGRKLVKFYYERLMYVCNACGHLAHRYQ